MLLGPSSNCIEALAQLSILAWEASTFRFWLLLGKLVFLSCYFEARQTVGDAANVLLEKSIALGCECRIAVGSSSLLSCANPSVSIGLTKSICRT